MARKVAEGTDRKHLFKRGDVWYVKRVEDGRTLIQSTAETDLGRARTRRDYILNPFNLRNEKDRAEAILSRVAGIERQLAKIDDEIPATMIMHGWQAYTDQPSRPDSGESTLRQYEFQYEAFARWMEANQPDAAELRHVTQAIADRYAGHLQKKVAATTFNRHMNLLALVWRVLERTAKLSSNPWKQIGRKRFAVHSRRELTIEELGRVCGAAQGEMRLLLALGIFCGLRLGDAACLEWSNADMVRGVISLIPMKTARRSQKRVVLPIHRTLFEMLAEIPAKRRKGYVLPDTAAAYLARRDSVCIAVNRLFASVDIKTNAKSLTRSEREAVATDADVPKVKGCQAKRACADAGFHSLRHTFVSLCAAGGVPQSVVQSLVGHGSPAMTAHYTHIGLETARQAVAMLPDVTQGKMRPEGADAAGTKLEGVLAGLEGLSKEELVRVVARAKEMLGK